MFVEGNHEHAAQQDRMHSLAVHQQRLFDFLRMIELTIALPCKPAVPLR